MDPRDLLLGTWDYNKTGRAITVQKGPGTNSLTIAHPLVRGGAPCEIKDFIRSDDTVQYEGFSGRLVDGSEIWWDRGVTWTKISGEPADRVRVAAARPRSSSGVRTHSRADGCGHSSRPDPTAGVARAPAASNPGLAFSSRPNPIVSAARAPGASNPELASAAHLLITEADIASRGLEVEQFQARLEPEDKHRNQVREGTKIKVAKELRLGRWGDRLSEVPRIHHADRLTLFQDQSSYAHQSPAALSGYNSTVLGRYEVLAVPCRADLDSQWHMYGAADRRSPFFVLHAVALNVGESAHAHDFNEYSTSTGLNAGKYVRDMGRIFENVLMAAESLGIAHLVFFPFGMGAFMRNLELCDSQYAGGAHNSKNVQLRLNLCQCFAACLAKRWPFIVYLCLTASGDGGEADINTDCFVRAFSSAGIHRAALKVCLGADSLELAQELAMSGQTALVNGANRALIGNHWFSGGARRAIDENLHRRSWLLSAFAYALNDFSSTSSRPALRPAGPGDADALANRVRQLGGKLMPLRLHEADASHRVGGKGTAGGGDGKGAPPGGSASRHPPTMTSSLKGAGRSVAGPVSRH
eukprot:TRINITY_DN31878_c0_g1_i1.p1 TRINITY_DN31878_c0_g1~~TRINITY_DN31878_c0_g1_i1.p1  ORF type:complete len:583 (-),score=54.51 TRINITY_DN31878_c0_g1_i1:23-1771(-)